MIALGHPNSPSAVLRASSASGQLAQAVPVGPHSLCSSANVSKQCTPLCWAPAGGEVVATPCEEHAKVWGRL